LLKIYLDFFVFDKVLVILLKHSLYWRYWFHRFITSEPDEL